MKTLVNVGEEDVGVGFGGIESEGFAGAAFGIRGAAERELHESKTIFADAGTGSGEKTPANEGFGGRKIGAAIKDHGEAEERRSKAAVGEVDGFLEILGGGVELAETVVGETEVVISAIRRGNLVDDGLEVGETGLRIALDEQLGAFFEGAHGFARHGEFVDGDDGIVARVRGGLRRGRLRETLGREE